MYKFSDKSKRLLNDAHPDLQRLFNEVIKAIDCTILCSYRGEVEQDFMFSIGKSKKQFPDSKHNIRPSHAIDVSPHPIDWNDTSRFYYFAGIVMGIASQLNINLRWGGDWNRNNQFKDETFLDLVHFELITSTGMGGIDG